jgi:hypothetical protein
VIAATKAWLGGGVGCGVGATYTVVGGLCGAGGAVRGVPCPGGAGGDGGAGNGCGLLPGGIRCTAGARRGVEMPTG